MTLEVIYVTRHGFRSNWLVDPSNGTYTSMLRSPTGKPADPALTAHGVEQARELGERLMTVDPPIERVYSSLYYRCLQTVEPFVRKATATAIATASEGRSLPPVRGETGIGEWYGAAEFEHPVPETPEGLSSHFPAMLDPAYTPAVVPGRKGEGIGELHDRVAATMRALVAECDRDGVRAILLCSHAATIIALGRVLTGNMPENIGVEDFGAFTCGLSVYRRRKESGLGGSGGVAGAGSTTGGHHSEDGSSVNDRANAGNADPQIGDTDWRGGRGVAGGWDCELDSDCSHLSQGPERGWRFSGDESFKGTGGVGGLLSITDAGLSMGVVVEGRGKGGSKKDGGDGGAGPRL
ncbi:histidine phosphatase superfamily [Schizothecium vesticola]|uniref:Histidine phosphatase superfamily n=1 Tax=Schizothecium vesticola TaxID=314040 RepID=A0AA40F8X5_9PEZI|nr:histidine phosphatase superfamily [Schizothecium vesticola]